MKRGIFLVANLKSQSLCENLIYSIRASGCELPIRLIHFGGAEIDSVFIKSQVEFFHFENFPHEAKLFIQNLRSVLTDCPMGFLYRFLAWFSDWEEFIYSDNDIVALCNWEKLFDYLNGYDLVHADEEYTTKGQFNYEKPEEAKRIFGDDALESAITAGHIVVRSSKQMTENMKTAIEWFRRNEHIPKKHDQSLLHVASLLGRWKILNLCKPPFSWLSSWAGDYPNSLSLIQQLQIDGTTISHLHYSGGAPRGDRAIEDLLFSAMDNRKRMIRLSLINIRIVFGFFYIKTQAQRVRRFVKRQRKRFNYI